MPGPRKTPLSVPVQTVPRGEFSGEEPTAVGSDPIAALETIDRRVRGLSREHKASVEVDQAEHRNIRLSVDGMNTTIAEVSTKLEQTEQKLEEKIEATATRMDQRFDGLHTRLDVIANGQFSLKVTQTETQLKVQGEQQVADSRLNTEKRIAKISSTKEIVLKFVGPLAGVLGGLAAAYAAGLFHGC